jgi:hypothetical protein
MICAWCRTPARGDAFGWRGYRCEDLELDEPPAVAFYCALCSLELFGPLPYQELPRGDRRNSD